MDLSRFNTYRQKAETLAAKFTIAQAAQDAAKADLEAAESRAAATDEAQRHAQETAKAVQQLVHDRVASLVTRCLEAVFDERYEFDIIFEEKRGRTEARLVLRRGGSEIDPMSSVGGGVVDVVAFALRLACLLLHRPPLRRLLVLDEPFKYVGAADRARVRQLLEELTAELGVQFFIVTHMDELRLGTVVDMDRS